jgi:uncharacterized protein (DUF608 family)
MQGDQTMPKKQANKTAKSHEGEPYSYQGTNRRCVAFPLGGVGTGTVALCGDGTLRQWQLWNHTEHQGYLPDSFFAITAQVAGEKPVLRALQSSEFTSVPKSLKTVSTNNDHLMPDECKASLEAFPTVDSTKFVGKYPVAQVCYRDKALPLDVSLEAFSPMIPLDSDASGLPLIFWNFTLTNNGDCTVKGTLLGSLQNGVGHVPGNKIKGVASKEYGKNRNRCAAFGKITGVLMDRMGQKKNDPYSGEMFLGTTSKKANCLTAWTARGQLRRELEKSGCLPEGKKNSGASRKGRTINAAVGVPYNLKPGQSVTVTLLSAWRFPNRETGYEQWRQKDKDFTRQLGNYYCEQYGSMTELMTYVSGKAKWLTDKTRLYCDTFFDSTLPPELLEAVSSQSSIIRTEVCFRTPDGYFYGFEGAHGASTKKPDGTFGCCPMNCTHVWNYEVSLSRLYPDLERSMREIEFDEQQTKLGDIPHRVLLPLRVKPKPGSKQVGPDRSALDGMFGAILKYSREAQRTGNARWAKKYWPNVRQLLNCIIDEFDPEGLGLISGEQANTYDISTWGANAMFGTLYLASLAAVLEMAEKLQLGKKAEDARLLDACKLRLSKGPDAYERVWNGEYYINEEDPEHDKYGWGTGIHCDSLLGQWYAHLLGLGNVFPPSRIKKTLRSMMKYNFRNDWTSFRHKQRAFVRGHETGLLICSWPNGGRPKKPVLYCDEVWTGMEYEVAALCLYEGMKDAGMAIVSAVGERQNGETRNPWNQVECGDHYVRAMSSWSLLDAASGVLCDGITGKMEFSPRMQRAKHRSFYIDHSSWGQVRREKNEITVSVAFGKLSLNQFCTDLVPDGKKVKVYGSEGKAVAARAIRDGKELTLAFKKPLTVKAGETLKIVF